MGLRHLPAYVDKYFKRRLWNFREMEENNCVFSGVYSEFCALYEEVHLNMVQILHES